MNPEGSGENGFHPFFPDQFTEILFILFLFHFYRPVKTSCFYRLWCQMKNREKLSPGFEYIEEKEFYVLFNLNLDTERLCGLGWLSVINKELRRNNLCICHD
jgi:hypothetical protein